jgi:LmbE family N-acetylglucosaminyl deacetylase
MKERHAAVIVAHPDDETLWAGGTILLNPSWNWQIVSLCRNSDEERSYKFKKAMKILNSIGVMGDLDDGPEQNPLDEKEVELAITDLIPSTHFNLIITHSPSGEYTRHKRHEEIGKAVINLWHSGKIITDELWMFAYEDGNRKYLPNPIKNVPVYKTLTNRIWLKKYEILTKIYGFNKNSWEAETTPSAESFWQFTDSQEAIKWLRQFENSKIE